MPGLLLLAVLGCARGETPPQPAADAPTSSAAAAQGAPSAEAAGRSFEAEGPTIPLTFAEHSLQVEVADSDAERQKGLMYRLGLAPDHGMVFVYPDERERGFWMKNTRIPLSIAFADQQGRIVHIADMAPLDEHTTRSYHPAMYAIEVQQGWYAEHGVRVGSKVEGLPGPSRE